MLESILSLIALIVSLYFFYSQLNKINQRVAMLEDVVYKNTDGSKPAKAAPAVEQNNPLSGNPLLGGLSNLFNMKMMQPEGISQTKEDEFEIVEEDENDIDDSGSEHDDSGSDSDSNDDDDHEDDHDDDHDDDHEDDDEHTGGEQNNEDNDKPEDDEKKEETLNKLEEIIKNSIDSSENLLKEVEISAPKKRGGRKKKMDL